MGNSAPNPQITNLNHLTSNPDYQNILSGIYQSNDQFSFNQIYYNMQNPNSFFEGPVVPIKINRSTPRKIKLSLQKKSLQLVPFFKEELKIATLNFTFSSSRPTLITFFIDCSENVDLISLKTLAIIEKQQSDDKSLRIHRFNAGKKLRFSSETMFLDMNLLKNPSELNKDEYSLIIKMETEEEEIEKELIYTYCAIAQGKIEVLKQKIEFADKALLMYEIYGNSSKDSRENEDPFCSVCLTDISNIVIFPCEHMCLCYKCCQDLRIKTSKCPICRNSNRNY